VKATTLQRLIDGLTSQLTDRKAPIQEPMAAKAT
jgi:hypothetical protein